MRAAKAWRWQRGVRTFARLGGKTSVKTSRCITFAQCSILRQRHVLNSVCLGNTAAGEIIDCGRMKLPRAAAAALEWPFHSVLHVLQGGAELCKRVRHAPRQLSGGDDAARAGQHGVHHPSGPPLPRPPGPGCVPLLASVGIAHVPRSKQAWTHALTRSHEGTHSAPLIRAAVCSRHTNLPLMQRQPRACTHMHAPGCACPLDAFVPPPTPEAHKHTNAQTYVRLLYATCRGNGRSHLPATHAAARNRRVESKRARLIDKSRAA